GFVAGRAPSLAQARIEEFLRCGLIAGQAVGELRRALAVIGVDVADQRFRRPEPGFGDSHAAEQEQKDCKNAAHPKTCRIWTCKIWTCRIWTASRLALFASILIII